MAKVFSYIRFSSDKQKEGESVRRQKETRDRWLARHPEHILDTELKLSGDKTKKKNGNKTKKKTKTSGLSDLGVSGFRGRNLDKDKGALGQFVQLAKDGKIPKGSILLLEDLDRFSRQSVWDASRVFSDLVNAGVKIQTLNPEQLIDQNNVSNMEVVLPVIIKMQLANEESRKKSDRSRFNWQKKREEARDGSTDAKAKCGRHPAWLLWSKKEKRFTIKDEAGRAVEYIYKRTAAGVGQRALLHELTKNPEYKSMGGSGKWSGSYIQAILCSRAVLGEYQPKQFDEEKGKRVPDGPPIKDYFPAVIDQRLWDRAQAAKAQRTRERGPSGKFVNLFTGIITGFDGHACHVMAASNPNDKKPIVRRRFVSYGHLRSGKTEGQSGKKGGKTCPYGVDYFDVERAVLGVLGELKVSELTPPDVASEKSIQLREQERDGIDVRMLKLNGALRTFTSSEELAELRSALAELRSRRDELQREIDAMRRSQATAGGNPLGEVQDILGYIDRQPEDERHSLRLRLRTLIGSLVEEIILEPYKQGRIVSANVHIRLKPSGYRAVLDAQAAKPEDFRHPVPAEELDPTKLSARQKALILNTDLPSFAILGGYHDNARSQWRESITPEMIEDWDRVRASLGKKGKPAAKGTLRSGKKKPGGKRKR